MLDFAENYSFVVQDAVQGYYWNNSQATLHPLVAYYRKEDGSLGTISFCVVSDCLKHDATAVYAFISVIIAHLKKLIPGLSLVRYFSDGAASQYKNCKNFLNLCYHEEDFAVKAEWHFFATSHRKSPCDGASLQATTGNHILNAKELFSWAKANISGIEMLFVSGEEIEKCEKTLEPRLNASKTIAGTRSHHSFVPISSHSLKIRRISSDKAGTSVKVTSSSWAIASQSFTPGQFVTAAYDKAWYLVNYKVNFMRSRNAGTTIHLFIWPSTRDECWIPFEHVLSTVQEPLQITKGRIKQYKLSSPAIQMIEESFKKCLECYCN